MFRRNVGRIRSAPEARDYVRNLAVRIKLIDGSTRADLMIDHDVGVTAATTYVVKRINSDYFS
jgi:restriction system protein